MRAGGKYDSVVSPFHGPVPQSAWTESCRPRTPTRLRLPAATKLVQAAAESGEAVMGSLGTETFLRCTISGYPALDFEIDLRHGRNFNRNVYQAVLDGIGVELTCQLGHVVISGRNFWIPTRIVLEDPPESKAIRTVGDVYLYIPGQTIVFTYGVATETAKVATFGIVRYPDVLQAIGDMVWQKTVIEGSRETPMMRIVPFEKEIRPTDDGSSHVGPR
jgi:hypothetical protein